MTHQDRDRLAFSLVLALVIHAVIIVMLTLVDWEIHEYPQTEPVFVELLDYQSTPPVIEPVPEPVEEIPPEPVTDAEPEEPPAEDPQPEPVAPVVQEAERPAVPAQAMASDAPPRDAPAGSFSTEDLPWLRSDPSANRDETRTADAELFTFNEATETGQLPAWVAEGTIQPLSSLAPGDQEILAEKQETVPGFQDRLDQILQSLRSSAIRADQSRQPVTGDETDSTEVSLPGDSRLEWVGGGSRSPVGMLALPEISAADLGGLVPARITYIIVFDVNSDGLVVPGSLILRQNSGYTAADQKVRRAVSSWRFEPAPGSQPVIAICTLILERDDLR